MARIHVANSDEECEAIYRLRYEIYVEELGKKPPGADHSRRMLREELDTDGVLFFAEANGLIVATCRNNHFSESTMASAPPPRPGNRPIHARISANTVCLHITAHGPS